ncbi:hypothetical protein CDD80_4261 [Ophiocordyceps camponoti-rufipedis]|uniref:Nucleic acid-binding protein n=1 Tax=Ophiocordyceps camponoti-rufipedis TaxID=2004952 RepID=A0A2C5YVJ3_9HYPO|nr:hypothetical protein CDD80_4261 [Ophiocordyceps camponoti-rufipedis]
MASFILRRSAAVTMPSAARGFSSTAARDLAKINIIGKVLNSPVASTTNSGRGLVKYTVLSQTHETKPASHFRVTVFADGPRRDQLMNLAKGTLVYVEADASMSTYLDNDGRKQATLGILQRAMTILRKPEEMEEDNKSSKKTEE